MDTKWKRFKYHQINKLIAVFIVLFAAVTLLNIGMYFIFLQEYHVEESNYFETPQFQRNFIQKAGYVRDWIGRYTEEEIFEEEDAEVLSARREHFALIQRELVDENESFFYFAKNDKTGQVITNIPKYTGENEEIILKEILNKNYVAQGNLETLDIGEGSLRYSNYYDGESINDEEADSYKIYGYMDEESLEKSIESSSVEEEGKLDIFTLEKSFFDEMLKISESLRGKQKSSELNKHIIILICGVLAFGYLIYSTGKVADKSGIQWGIIDKIPFEIQGIGLIIFATFSLLILSALLRHSAIEQDIINHIVGMEQVQLESILRVRILYGVWCVDVLAGLTVFLSIVRHLKNKSFLQNTLIGKFVRWMYQSFFTQGSLPIMFLLGGIGLIAVNLILLTIAIAARSMFFLAYIGMFNVLVFLLIFKVLLDFKKICMSFRRIANGDIHHQVQVDTTLPALKSLAYDMNHVREGLHEAVQEIAKKERMKTELITNVSHDLKTPLTSIISYIDLLKAEKVENEKAKDYIHVLGDRSQRLKQLIEDLIEASKASTGNMKTEAGPLALNHLIEQIIGEYTDRLEKENLEVIFQKIEDVTILADSRHMWRITENLLSNIMKYAMPHTRVYVEVKQEDHEGIFVFRNISKEPIQMDVKELTERFVQGDESRNAQGSGLGLAIASSLATLQKGSLEITTEGDLFKVEVRMPISA